MNFRLAVIAIYVLGEFSCAKGCASKPAPAPSKCPTEVLIARHIEKPPVLDGEGEEKGWLDANPTPAYAFTDGGVGRPHTETRAIWNGSALYLLFYAGDENLENDDFMGAELVGGNGKTVAFKVSPNGRIDGPIEIQAGVDHDGTVADAGDDDEEWLVEAAIPWALLGKADEVKVRFSRDDKPKDAEKRTLLWPAPCDGSDGFGVIRLQAPARAP